MASTTLYPPIVDSYTPAFIADGDSPFCRVYFSLSKFSTPAKEIKSIHVSVVRQSSGQSVINGPRKVDISPSGPAGPLPVNEISDRQAYRTSEILIVNGSPTAVIGQENLYYIDILNEDIKGNGGSITEANKVNWEIGVLYKIQLRFSTVAYSEGDGDRVKIGIAEWLNMYANNFSEWSTYTITKAIGRPVITIPNFNYNSGADDKEGNSVKIYNLSSSTLELTGSYSNPDISEILYSYRFKLYGADGGLLEESDLIYANQYTPNQMYYLFNTEFKDNEFYQLKFEYETLNKYTETKVFDLTALLSYSEISDFRILTAESGDSMNHLTSIEAEQTDGRIALKIYSKSVEPYFGNICIRRSDSKSNFMVWEDIKIFQVINENVNNLPLVYDYTIESGVWYKYGIQIIDNSGFRSAIMEGDPVKREFDYAFLLGENNKQLRLLFDNTMGSFKHTYSETKTDTIGGKHPFITRNGNMDYKTFPIAGLISFNMDEDNLFTNMLDMYKYSSIVDLYNKEEKTMYDYTYERDFRDKVLNFLGDGKPKLFKSPTEGNVIVRLMDISTTPNQQLGRLVYSFTSNAYEVAETTMDNYLKYNFYNVGEYSSNLNYVKKDVLGQIIMNIPVGANLFELISEKYSNPDVVGNIYNVETIKNLELQFTGNDLIVKNSAGKEVYGHNITLIQGGESSTITIYGQSNTGEGDIIEDIPDTYRFDSLMEFSPTESLIIQGGINTGSNLEIPIIVNFTYDVSVHPKRDRIVLSKEVSKNIGQLSEVMYPGESLYNKTYFKYFYEYGDSFRKLTELKGIAIEADEGAVFRIIDLEDIEGSLHVMNATEILDLYELGSISNIIYVGKQDKETGVIDETVPCNYVSIDYIYYLIKGIYAEEV